MERAGEIYREVLSTKNTNFFFFVRKYLGYVLDTFIITGNCTSVTDQRSICMYLASSFIKHELTIKESGHQDRALI